MSRERTDSEVEDLDKVMYAARTIFEAYDTDDDGFLSMEEMRCVVVRGDSFKYRA